MLVKWRMKFWIFRIAGLLSTALARLGVARRGVPLRRHTAATRPVRSWFAPGRRTRKIDEGYCRTEPSALQGRLVVRCSKNVAELVRVQPTELVRVQLQNSCNGPLALPVIRQVRLRGAQDVENGLAIRRVQM